MPLHMVPAHKIQLSWKLFFDPIFDEKMEELNIPGAVFALVKDGQVFFQKGYGFADLERQIPVDPERTVFRVCSVSKQVTYTAVMQLYDRGLISLDDDINYYLTHFKIDNNYSESVRIEHLLTHTAGFDDKELRVGALRKEDMLPLGEYLAGYMPPYNASWRGHYL